MKTIYNNKDMEYKVIVPSDYGYISHRMTVVSNQVESSDFYCEVIIILGDLVYILKNGYKWGEDINRILSNDEKYNIAEAIIRYWVSCHRGESDFDRATRIQNWALMFDRYNGLFQEDLIKRFIK